ncbi:hypothetical protein AbraIFM66951_001109 [Aspergillus brasiliensis]|uniref:DUF4350 domain-containing protein n=1 Tax=Aspergillus brasiliensis TaxID=319629 RepID=A0A9W6DS89_9EURO|nr:hypothetical protein AbraCBS73388_000643 [Aspergillus brasiliensis]GKZ48866.1 hypothetical protein AbraIFM66951_001109 [Aspergillus brasiliensis]
MASSGREDIALLCLGYRETLDDNYESLLGELSDRYNLVRLPTASIARTYLANQRPKSVIVTDGGICEPQNQGRAKRLKTYIEDGGIVIFALDFASTTSGNEFNNFFGQVFGVSWKYGGRCNATYGFNGNCSLPIEPCPKSSYTMEAHLIRNASPGEQIVVPLEGSMLRHSESSQAPVVGKKLGKGYLIYCGNESVEVDLCRVLVSICN